MLSCGPTGSFLFWGTSNWQTSGLVFNDNVCKSEKNRVCLDRELFKLNPKWRTTTAKARMAKNPLIRVETSSNCVYLPSMLRFLKEQSKSSKSCSISAMTTEPKNCPENRTKYGRGLSSLFPLPSVPGALSFTLSPASKLPTRPSAKEASAEERLVVIQF